MYALESAVDELAEALGMDPVELRLRNEPERDPERDVPWSTRNLVACLRQGAERLGWADRDPRPGIREDGRWLVGTGVAAATYPTRRRPSQARIEAVPGRPFVVSIDASDIGTGAWTALTEIAADALRVPIDQVACGSATAGCRRPRGPADPPASLLGPGDRRRGRELRDREIPPGGLTVTGVRPGDEAERYSSHAFGAQFAEVRVDRTPARSGCRG